MLFEPGNFSFTDSKMNCVCKKHKTSSDGKTDLKDGPHPGQSKTAAIKANMLFYSDYGVCQEMPT